MTGGKADGQRQNKTTSAFSSGYERFSGASLLQNALSAIVQCMLGLPHML